MMKIILVTLGTIAMNLSVQAETLLDCQAGVSAAPMQSIILEKQLNSAVYAASLEGYDFSVSLSEYDTAEVSITKPVDQSGDREVISTVREIKTLNDDSLNLFVNSSKQVVGVICSIRKH